MCLALIWLWGRDPKEIFDLFCLCSGVVALISCLVTPLSPFLYQEGPHPLPSHIWKVKFAHSRSVTEPKLIPFWLLKPFSALLVQGLCTQTGLALGKYSNFVFSCSQVKKVRWERHNNMFLSPPSPLSEHFASTYLLHNKPLTSTVSVFLFPPSPQVLSAH